MHNGPRLCIAFVVPSDKQIWPTDVLEQGGREWGLCMLLFHRHLHPLGSPIVWSFCVLVLKLLLKLLVSYMHSFMKSLLWATDPVVILSFLLLTVTPSAWRQSGRIFPVTFKKEWIPVNFSVLVTLFKHLLLSAHRPVLSSYFLNIQSKVAMHF